MALVQTAAHVSGTAFYYQPEPILTAAMEEGVSLPWTNEQNVYGVSLHPKYGGWFAIRGNYFVDIKHPDFL